MTRKPLLALLLLLLSLLAAGSALAQTAGNSSSKSDSGTKSSGNSKSGASGKSSGSSKSDSGSKSGDSNKPSGASKSSGSKAGDSSKAAAGQKPDAASQTSAAPRSKNLLVKTDEATMRAEASPKGKAIETYTQFTPVQVLGTEDKYTKVQVGDKTGYILTSSLTDSPYVSTTMPGNERIRVRATSAGDSLELMTFGTQHYPLRVLAKDGKRVKVADFEGDGGWVHESYLSLARYVVSNPPPGQGEYINLRDAPGLDKTGKAIGAKRFTAEKGTVFQVLEEQNGWLRVKYVVDGDEGWCSANVVWGWNVKDDAPAPAAKPAAAQ